nr:unnamed protein product [Digitaria exilis]
MTLQDHLKEAVNGLNHESLNVRYMVACCAEQSRTAVGKRLKLVCADCLGALGAVDPAKIKHLARAFRAAADTTVQDAAALAIQELLKLAGGQSEVCIQAIFTLLDNLGQWVDDLKQEIALSQSSYATAGKHGGKLKGGIYPDYEQDQMLVQCSNVAGLLTAIPKVSGLIRGCLKDLPTYQWLTVLSQLISRICHQNADVVRIVKYIITSILREYPQQALWMMAAVSKSTVPARKEAAAEILQSAKKGCRRGSQNSALFIQFPTLIEHLIKLCFHPGQPKARTINISTEFSSLKRMMPLGIILPVQQALTVTLPSYDPNMSDQAGFHPFSVSEHPTIAGIADEAEILSSLQKPKKVVFIGSDGVSRPFLCKPKDDLRKDSRMMEFNAMINRLLSKVPESRRRKLYIRTFAVVPLTEDCGMVEWVPNTRGLRHILQDIYITDGKFDKMKTNPQIKKIYDTYHGKMPDDEMLKTKILPMFPPVFHKWFLTTFSEPAAWFRARVAYAHTTAVWSMVGHIVGLGDRHGENILFDSTTGDCVHVDFSCLFDRGLQLDKPEVVPFRLTQNMIDGLGITGYEGIFLKVCEITLSVLRTHKETLMTVLETFIHDPLVEWNKNTKSSGGEAQNPHAQRAITNINARLQGVVVGVKASPSLPLSVEGQARRLIAEAVNLSNLGKMYIWWMPWF